MRTVAGLQESAKEERGRTLQDFTYQTHSLRVLPVHGGLSKSVLPDSGTPKRILGCPVTAGAVEGVGRSIWLTEIELAENIRRVNGLLMPVRGDQVACV